MKFSRRSRVMWSLWKEAKEILRTRAPLYIHSRLFASFLSAFSVPTITGETYIQCRTNVLYWLLTSSRRLYRQRRQDKMKNEILALRLMSRTRVRVSSGVYEVTLLSVNEWLHTIQVMWGDGYVVFLAHVGRLS